MIMEMLCEKNKQKEARPDNESFPVMSFFDGLRGGKRPFPVMTCMGGDYIYGWARWQGQQRESELPRAQTLCWTQVGIESIEWRGGSICLFDEQGGLTSPNALNSSCFIICHFRPLVNTCGCFCPLNSSQSSTSDESKPSTSIVLLHCHPWICYEIITTTTLKPKYTHPNQWLFTKTIY